MTFISKVIKYVIATQKKLCYSLDIVRGMDGMKKEERGILDARTLACYIKHYYNDVLKMTNEISPLKLQKSLYFCFAYWGGFIRYNNKYSSETKEITFDYSEILFENNIEAWVYVPVVPDVYHEKDLDKYREEKPFGDKTYVKEFIDNILNDVLVANDFKLVEVSHQDKCWKKNFKPNSLLHNIIIPPEEIITEYAKNY